MEIGIERLTALCYKLQMMGIPVEDPSCCYGDNMGVIHNTQRVELQWRRSLTVWEIGSTQANIQSMNCWCVFPNNQSVAKPKTIAKAADTTSYDEGCSSEEGSRLT